MHVGKMRYTAVIRTLGTAGDKYQKLLDSLGAQTIKPEAILVYIAEGYPLPKETIGTEKYIYVKKGMVAQRALRYDEAQTEWMLFLDDDLYLPPHFAETLYNQLLENGADVISPDVFPNDKRSFKGKVMMTLSGRMLPRKDDGKWGYRVMHNGGYSYNSHPVKPVYQSQTNAGACFFCKKESFLKIHFEEELWMDKLQYAQGDDQVMYYKMYLQGMGLFTSYNTGIVHLDAGDNLNPKKSKVLLYADLRFKILFWYRFVYSQERACQMKMWDWLCIGYLVCFAMLVSLFKCRFGILSVKCQAVRDARRLIRSGEVKPLTLK